MKQNEDVYRVYVKKLSDHLGDLHIDAIFKCVCEKLVAAHVLD
jgi:hypothetical protein